MNRIDRRAALALALGACGWLSSAPVRADDFSDTIATFRKTEQSGKFFNNAYGYAVFPTIGKAGIGIGGAHGKGKVYEKGKVIGDSTMNQLSIGFQLGAEGFSEIIFFENEAALKKFTSGSFEFSADAQAVALTAGANVKAGTTGAGARASLTKNKAAAAAVYNNGMAVFTIVKGGLMYEVSLAGQKYSFTPAGK
jgi:lipid-binding SYLF domain-containing protein